MKTSYRKNFVVLGFLMVTVMGCASTPASTMAPVPTDTPTPTSTSQEPASPPTPVTTPELPIPTPNVLSEQASTFAEPILQAIVSQAPDIADDFSFDTGNWDLGYGENPAQIVEGVLRLTVADATQDEWAGARHVAMSADDFVIQFDVRVPVMELDSHLSISWRWLPSDNSSYWLTLFPRLNGAWSLGGAGNNFFQAANGNLDSIRLGEWFTVTIIGQGNHFAALINGQPLGDFEDTTRPVGRVVLGMNIFSGDAIAEFDNVKYWNLANVPGLP
ncbi:MAG: hypothetical protein IT312_06430 [Anaerolineales bacterium]|nr:hypothetical protein [Anaerolineales bacterium]